MCKTVYNYVWMCHLLWNDKLNQIEKCYYQHPCIMSHFQQAVYNIMKEKKYEIYSIYNIREILWNCLHSILWSGCSPSTGPAGLGDRSSTHTTLMSLTSAPCWRKSAFISGRNTRLADSGHGGVWLYGLQVMRTVGWTSRLGPLSDSVQQLT